MASVTSLGLALPLLAFITWPVRKLMSFSLPPWIFVTCFGLFAIASSMRASMAAGSKSISLARAGGCFWFVSEAEGGEEVFGLIVRDGVSFD